MGAGTLSVVLFTAALSVHSPAVTEVRPGRWQFDPSASISTRHPGSPSRKCWLKEDSKLFQEGKAT